MIVDTILFDLDGTLIDTNEIIIQSFNHTFKTFFPDLELSRDTILTFIGPSLHATFSNYTDDEEQIQQMIITYREHYKKIEHALFELYPNVYEVVERLSKEGYNLGIVTTKFKEAAMPSFLHFGLDKFFDVFVALDDVKNPKPHREPIDVALSQMENVNGVIMIGDNQSDIMAGKNAGVLSAGVAWSIKGKDYLSEVSPDYMLDDMEDLFEILESHNIRK